MIRSMTGYGRGEAADSTYKFRVEIKSVNSKYADITVKGPKIFAPYEDKVKACITKKLRRGKMDVYLSYEALTVSEGMVGVNIPLASAYREAIGRLAEGLGMDNDVSLTTIIRMPDVFGGNNMDVNMDDNWPTLEAAVDMAASQLRDISAREGAYLIETIRGGKDKIMAKVDEIAERSPVAIEANFAKYRARIEKLLGDTSVDEGRLLQEAAIMSEKYDINEEIVRLRSHFVRMEEIIAEDDMIGKKLDFLIQEMNRETNTIGSKANDTEISRRVVFIKNEIEKIREQVQNLE